jgi:tetratricopeptide (TPR) repeat protein
MSSSIASDINKDQLANERKRIRNARLYVEASLAKNNNKYNQAEALYLECLKNDPNDAASMYELASLYLSQERMNDAKKYAFRAAEIDPQNNYYKALLASVYQTEGNYKQSIEVLKELLSKDPSKTDYLRQLAYIYILDKNYLGAIDLMNQLEKKRGISESISLQKQQLYIGLNETDKAINEIEKLIREFPFETKYYALLAELCIQYEKDEKAIWAYEKIAEIDPTDAYVHISLFDFYRKKMDDEKAFNELKKGFSNPDLDVETKFQVLLSYYTPEQIYTTKNKLARELVWIIEKTHPDDAKAMSLKADLLYRNKENAEARELLLKVVAKNNDQYSWFELLLIVDSDLRNFEAMIVDGERTIKLFPNEPLPYLITGLGYFQADSFRLAEKNFKWGLNYSKTNVPLTAQFHSYLGDTYHELGEIEKSDKAYDKALSYDTTNSLVLNNYAYYLSLRGEKLDQADKMSKKAVELDVDNSSNMDSRAWVLYKLERYDEALIWIEKAYEIDGKENAELNEHYGDILFKMGNKKKAIKYWKRAKDLGGESEFLEKKISEKKLFE